jgi:hypothetical protein
MAILQRVVDRPALPIILHSPIRLANLKADPFQHPHQFGVGDGTVPGKYRPFYGGDPSLTCNLLDQVDQG